MCGTCGCGQEVHDDHHHDHDHAEPEATEHRRLLVEQDLLAANDVLAAHVREHLAARRTLALNLVSSPGAGKTTLLVETLRALIDRMPVAVIEGDQATDRDAVRIGATGVRAVQINTGRGCHLDAAAVHGALHDLDLPPGGVLFVENVGNLVCPAMFDLGEAHKVVVLSTPEGDDKPLKYPHMFAASDLMVINKVDLLPYVDFDVERCVAAAREVNPAIEVLQVSAKTGAGMDGWIRWIVEHTPTGP
jgi:hydrogenase nickel incorporation protein HypB